MGMTPWEGILTDKQIRAWSSSCARRRNKRWTKGIDFPVPSPDKVTKTELHDYRIETLVESGLKIPWAIAFLPDGRKLVTERPGPAAVSRPRTASWIRKPIEGTPEVIEHGQGGLMEVALHPDYEKNGWIYLGFSDGDAREKRRQPQCITAVVRGRIKDHQVDRPGMDLPPRSASSAAAPACISARASCSTRDISIS
jgi:aldose sugar dehydrogenase